MKQLTLLIAKGEFGLKNNGARGRMCRVKKGDKFRVTTADYMNIRDGMANVDRDKRLSLGSGYRLTIAQIYDLFEVCS